MLQMPLVPLSLLPLLMNHRPVLHDQNFGLGLVDSDLISPMDRLMLVPLSSGYFRPWRAVAEAQSGVSSIESTKDELRINLDVQQFKPEELNVKVKDGFIVIEGKHEERSDEHGFVSRQFSRRYMIPKDIDEANISSSLSSDGVLSIVAKKKDAPEEEVREIPITQTNEPVKKHHHEKLNEKENADNEKKNQENIDMPEGITTPASENEPKPKLKSKNNLTFYTRSFKY